ncbi:MAG TPA: hypothetical protein VD993_02855 [Chitinophagaceae bacterium]|nr:hypothetical protein [Chitinophagaceae bacterium]
MRSTIAIAFLLVSSVLNAQNLNGIWRGKLTPEAGGCFPVYYLELQISEINNVISGNAYDYYDKTRFVRLDFNGRFNTTTKRLVLIEEKILTVQIPRDCFPCIKTYDLTYSQNGKDEFLTGDFKGHGADRRLACPPGRIVLQRMMQSEFPVQVRQNDTLARIQQAIQLKPREKEVVQTYILDTSHIKIELYDNAEIDNDTVSVFLNNTLLLYKKRLTDKALPLTVSAFPGTEYELMMYAENLGSIPPNTALMVITSGKKRYELRVSSSEQKSAVVKFVYQPPQSHAQ